MRINQVESCSIAKLKKTCCKERENKTGSTKTEQPLEEAYIQSPGTAIFSVLYPSPTPASKLNLRIRSIICHLKAMNGILHILDLLPCSWDINSSMGILRVTTEGFMGTFEANY